MIEALREAARAVPERKKPLGLAVGAVSQVAILERHIHRCFGHGRWSHEFANYFFFCVKSEDRRYSTDAPRS